MKLTVAVKLQPSAEQAALLLRTLEAANAAANRISALAWEHATFSQFKLHKLAYAPVRAEGVLAAQVVVRLIAKVADAYKLDQRTQRAFHRRGALPYDDRILRWYEGAVSIWTLGGRQHISFLCGERQRPLLACRQGESDLVYRGGQWYLFACVNIVEAPEDEPLDFLGVDLGIVNIATTSDGAVAAGGHLNGLRHRHRRLRTRLQAKGTRGTRRVLARRRRRERRMATHVNHTISKRIVAAAKGTKRGIVLEDLQGIRARMTARRPQRATLHSWAFHQLGQFVLYKARLAGLPVLFVDPRNTSRTCPACAHVAQANRPNQATFSCQSCGFSGLADYIAALNLRERGRAAVNLPYCSGPSGTTPGQSPAL
jgi:IS605 OrfB family transposase